MCTQAIPIGAWLRRAALTEPREIPFLSVRGGRASVLAAAVLGLGACAHLDALPPPTAPITEPKSGKAELGLYPVNFEIVPGWKADRHSVALGPFLASCKKLLGEPPEKQMSESVLMGSVKDWLPICHDAKRVRPGNDVDAQYFFESRFQAYMAVSNKGSTGLFTGYYEPELNGTWKADARFRVPIYARPKDIIGANLGHFDDKLRGQQIVGRLEKGRFVPYYDRATIESGALNGRQLEILWVDDPIDAFFLHIQGSGRVRLPDSTHIRIGYDGRNGRPYTAIGRELVAAGIMRLKDVTMPAIRRWMIENPVASQAVMRKNRSFVFFKVLKTGGPVGAQGVVLTPGRSLAVDPKHVPFGVPLWLDTIDPGTDPVKSLRRLVIAQDTGSAIKGPIRGDLFWGYGNAAGSKAGIMKHPGRYYLLLPRSLVPKPAA